MSWYLKNADLFIAEQKLIASYFPELHYNIKNNVVFLAGQINVKTIINSNDIKGQFKVRIQFPNLYPESYPVVFETSNQIPKNYHTNSDNTLCLGTEMEISTIFYQNKSIYNFIKNLLIPYLSGFIYHTNYGVFPFGERGHGIKGKLEFYRELIGTDNINNILKLLNEIRNDKLRGHHSCPCGNNKLIRNCHWNNIQKLLAVPHQIILQEIKYFNNFSHLT